MMMGSTSTTTVLQALPLRVAPRAAARRPRMLVPLLPLPSPSSVVKPTQPLAHRSSKRIVRRATSGSSGSSAPAPDGDGGSGAQKAAAPPAKRRWFGWLPNRASWELLAATWRLLRARLAAVVAVFAAKEAAVYALHRATQRLTNLVAEGALGVALPPGASPWYLYLESKFVEANFGYQAVVALFFALSLPFNIFLNASALSAAALLCTDQVARAAAVAAAAAAVAAPAAAAAGETAAAAGSDGGSGGGDNKAKEGEPPSGDSSSSSTSSSSSGTKEPDAAAGANEAAKQQQPIPPPPPPRPGPIALARTAVADAAAALAAARPLLRRAWLTDLLFNAWSLPLQAASLLVLPVPWTFPRLLAIQLAVPAAILGGKGPSDALRASRELMVGTGAAAGAAAAYAWPYIGLTLAARAVDAARHFALLLVPPRWWREVMEIPIALTLAFVAARVVVARLQDLLPVAAYIRAAERQQQQQQQQQDGPGQAAATATG